MNTPEYVPSLKTSEFTYDLPLERIAQEALPSRDSSKLLVHGTSSNSLEHTHFRDIPRFLPIGSLLVANASRVIAARLLLVKPTGGEVEVFLTRPLAPSAHPAIVLQSNSQSTWSCLIKGRNVQPGMTLKHPEGEITAEVLTRSGMEGAVNLSWESERSLSAVLHDFGHVPLPPYIQRNDRPDDELRYQTMFAREEGSVAAPTAGLHFTEGVIKEMQQRSIEIADVTLHVGLGTFKPIESDDIQLHVMHEEQFEVSLLTINALQAQLRKIDRGYITCVGTTSLRVVESLHWFGAHLLQGNEVDLHNVHVDQWSAFNPDLQHYSPIETLDAIKRWMQRSSTDRVAGNTSLLLAPGCRIAIPNALITNFHQPGSTLLLLIAAFVGTEVWPKLYEAAMKNNYRFLSYGDASLLSTRM